MPADAETMRALIERVEQASGADRELGAGIARAIGFVPEGPGRDTSSPWAWGPAYTASLDAAASLVPSGWDWATGSDLRAFHGAPAWARAFPPGEQRHGTGDCYAATPALALTAAALRARLAEMEARDE